MPATLNTEELIQRIHASPTLVDLVVTGGGSAAISDLLRVPGASKTLLEARVPYASAAMSNFLGAAPERYCSAATARAMAMAAFERGRRLTESSGEPSGNAHRLAGVACTASLASDRPKRGAHRAHVAVQTAALTLTSSLELVKDELEKGGRSRAEEESLVARLILNHVALACDVEERLPLGLAVGEEVHTQRTLAEPAWQDVLLGRIDAVCLGERAGPGKEPGSRVVFPGAFHPLHKGHLRMAEIAARRLAAPVEFELSIENVDKPPLDYTEIATRTARFTPRQPVWLTRTATFVEKSSLFPGATFVVGADTIARVSQPRYYGDDREACRAAVGKIADAGCRFLVFGRLGAEGFQTLADLELPAELRTICQEVPADEFRNDVSSTERRRTEQQNDD